MSIEHFDAIKTSNVIIDGADISAHSVFQIDNRTGKASLTQNMVCGPPLSYQTYISYVGSITITSAATATTGIFTYNITSGATITIPSVTITSNIAIPVIAGPVTCDYVNYSLGTNIGAFLVHNNAQLLWQYTTVEV